MHSVPEHDAEWQRTLNALRDPEPEVRRQAVERLGHLDEMEARVTPSLLPLLRDPDPDVRRAVLTVLGDSGLSGVDLLLPILDLLSDLSDAVRAQAAIAVAQIYTDSLAEIQESPSPAWHRLPSVEVLLQGLERAQARYGKRGQILATWALAQVAGFAHRAGRLRETRWQALQRDLSPRLLARLRDPDPDLRWRSGLGLGNLRPPFPDVVAGLSEALTDPADAVRDSASWALAMIGTRNRDTVSPLLDALADPSFSVRENAAEGLGIPTSLVDQPRPAEETLHRALRDALARQTPPGTSGWWLPLSMIVFVLVLLPVWSMNEVLLLVGVLLFHELGHYLGMVVFGYRDVRMFFIPFFGAAVAGRKDGAPLWQQAIVILLGPLPGIVVGFALALLQQDDWPQPLLHYAILMLLGLNALNLLPLMPMDGGRFVQLLLSPRRAGLRALLHLGMALGMIVIGVWLTWILIVIGAMMLLTVPAHYLTAVAGRALAERRSDLPARLEDLTPAQVRDLFEGVWIEIGVHPLGQSLYWMKGVLEAAAVRSLSLPLKVVFLAVYLAGFALAFVALGLDWQASTFRG